MNEGRERTTYCIMKPESRYALCNHFALIGYCGIGYCLLPSAHMRSEGTVVGLSVSLSVCLSVRAISRW